MLRIGFHFLLAACALLGASRCDAQTRIVHGGEFFFDTDPGLGAATAFNALDGAFDEVYEAASASSSGLSLGLHTLHVRLRDAAGNWSPAFRTVVSVEEPSVPLRNVAITQAEFFWDTDPGPGSGIPLLAFDGAYNEAFEQAFASAQGLPSLGLHTLNVRMLGSDGVWSTTFRTVVSVEAPSVPLRNVAITQAEYFWDSDPGPGSGIPLLAFDGGYNEAFEQAFATAQNVPSIGVHTLNVRMLGSDGVWSTAFRTVVSVESPSVPLRAVAITQAEYFWDSDPGPGSGTPLLAFDGAYNEAFEQVFADAQSVPSLGLHTLNVRMLGSDGVWSTAFRTVVSVEAPSVPIRSAAAAQAEFYWDTDPGEGNALPCNAGDGSFDEAFEQAMASTGTLFLSEGPHVLGLRMRDANGNWSPDFRTVVHLEPEPNAVRVAVKLMLEGPYASSSGLMSDALRTAQVLPDEEPYTALGYAFVGGGAESTVQPVLDLSGTDAIVDWVLVELRSAGDPATVVASRSALIQRDGDVVDVNGSSAVAFPVAPGNYHVAVLHRNHLGAMTLAPVAISATAVDVDLTQASTATFGTDARKSVSGAFPTQALWAGDVNFDGLLKYTGQDNDRDPILGAIGGVVPTNTIAGYHAGDVNMDGTVKYTGEGNDRDPILQNIGGVVPTNVRVEQVP